MARELQQSNKNELKILDSISGSEIVLYYRLPTTRERIAFNKSCFKEKGGKLINHTVAARAAGGEMVLAGIRDGDFVYGGTPLSSDPNSPNYREDWKALVKETAGDLLIALGMTVFEGNVQSHLLKALAEANPDEKTPAAAPELDDDFTFDLEGGDDIGPLAQS
jgi:hypothetical protein